MRLAANTPRSQSSETHITGIAALRLRRVTVKAVKASAGASLAVDQVIIEFA